MTKIEKIKLFNPEGDDSKENRKIIYGNPTNFLDLNNVKYTWAERLWTQMMDNFWVPQKVSLAEDRPQYSQLTKEEQRAYNGILSFLIFLDSVQVNNLGNIADYITAPEVKQALVKQQFQEALHANSYAYILESAIPQQAKEKVKNFWRTDSELLERNKYIADVYQGFVDLKDTNSFGEALVADLILEALYFYNGFNFFYNLSSRGMMNGTKDIIKYINRDEETHVALFMNIVKAVKKENPSLISDSMVYSMVEKAVKHEIAWGKHIIGDNIIGMSSQNIENHTHWRANNLLRRMGLEEKFNKVEKNPFKHLERIANIHGESDSKANFFETTVTEYKQKTVISGWDEIRSKRK